MPRTRKSISLSKRRRPCRSHQRRSRSGHCYNVNKSRSMRRSHRRSRHYPMTRIVSVDQYSMPMENPAEQFIEEGVGEVVPGIEEAVVEELQMGTEPATIMQKVIAKYGAQSKTAKAAILTLGALGGAGASYGAYKGVRNYGPDVYSGLKKGYSSIMSKFSPQRALTGESQVETESAKAGDKGIN